MMSVQYGSSKDLSTAFIVTAVVRVSRWFLMLPTCSSTATPGQARYP